MLNVLSAIDKIAFEIGSLQIRWYGIIIVCGMILALIYLCIAARRIDLVIDDCIELFLWIIPLAVVFARVFYVIVRPEDYFPWNSWDDFVDAIAIWDGGITILGGLVGGLIGIIIFAYRRRKKGGFWLNFGRTIDLVVGPLLVGQIIGRVGNFINQEAFGIAIKDPRFQKFPFAVYIDDPSGIEPDKMHLFEGEGWYAATFFYEMVWNAVGLAIIYAIWRRNRKYPGILGFFYLFWYMLGRGMLEFLRLDAVPVTQILCFVMVPLMAVAMLLYVVIGKSVQSFKKVNRAAESNTLYITELSEYDVANYKRAAKMIKSGNKLIIGMYYAKDFKEIDIDHAHYLDEVKPQKVKKKNNKKDKTDD